jgi:hypothetical protein
MQSGHLVPQRPAVGCTKGRLAACGRSERGFPGQAALRPDDPDQVLVDQETPDEAPLD